MPPAGNPISAQELKKLLTKAKNNSTFRDKLISSPAATLKAEGLRPDAKWVNFFGGLKASNFEKEMKKEILNFGTGEAGGA
jgi:hypothetical protein